MTLASAPVTWYVVRAGGIVGFAMLTVSVVLGLLLSGRARLRRWPRFALEDVHRYAGLLTAAFLAIHGLALLVDGYLPISLGDLLVPGIAPYRPFWTALGVVALELLAALALTNRLRSALPYRLWRQVHVLNFAVWALALVHGLGAGTDTRTPWALSLYAVSAASVAGLTAWRLLGGSGRSGWALGLWPATAAVVSAELVVAVALGPLVHG
ncbi:MAG TPA: ferric reductase-like transmembrane domain-containing protein [Gaiellaceae bacterium]|nr:ferric reductase-like transmembrane domain-containing protein [Gaiellaceae bacterium]